MIRRLPLALPMLATLVVGGVFLPAVTIAAQPRASVSIASDSVKLSDLFSGLEAGQDCDIGPAPAPGRRIVIGQAQLTAIAEQFGVDWQPGNRTALVMVERRARLIGRAELLPLLHAALVAEGAPGGAEIVLNSFAPLMVPAEIVTQPDIESLTYDRTTGRFSAELLYEWLGSDATRLHLTGAAQEMVDAAVLVRTMSAGVTLEAEDIEVIRVRKSLAPERSLSTAQEAEGLALRHRTMAGSPISSDQLVRPLMVTRGMPVLLRLENPGIVLTAKGEAIDGGAMDERIHILNTGSRAIVVARVTGPGQVQVDPASAPVLLSSEQSGLPPSSRLPIMPPTSDQ